jgi:hypothetical protein
MAQLAERAAAGDRIGGLSDRFRSVHCL